MACFICDLVTTETHRIVEMTTSTRGIPLDSVLYNFISKYFDVEIDEGAIVCDTCAALLDALDRFRCELEDVEHMLQLQITRKYKLNEMQVCRLDDRTAKRYRKGAYRRFACVECSFETDFADCLMPHSWRHDHQTIPANNSPISGGRSFSSDICRSCNLAFSSNESLALHSNEFHGDDDGDGDDVDADSMNTATSPAHLESDAECDDNDLIGLGSETNAAGDYSLQCEVSFDPSLQIARPNSISDLPVTEVSGDIQLPP